MLLGVPMPVLGLLANHVISLQFGVFASFSFVSMISVIIAVEGNEGKSLFLWGAKGGHS